MLYTVDVQWGNKQVKHYAWTLADAKAWMAKYPPQDIFISVKRFGNLIAYRYHH